MVVIYRWWLREAQGLLRVTLIKLRTEITSIYASIYSGLLSRFCFSFRHVLAYDLHPVAQLHLHWMLRNNAQAQKKYVCSDNANGLLTFYHLSLKEQRRSKKDQEEAVVCSCAFQFSIRETVKFTLETLKLGGSYGNTREISIWVGWRYLRKGKLKDWSMTLFNQNNIKI